jgi:hypothetical protein
MKILLVTLLLVCAQCVAATPPAQVVDACLKTDSIRAARHSEISVNNFDVENDEDLQRTSTTLKHRGHALGLWESATSKDFGLVFNASSIARKQILAIGADEPAPFDPYTAQRAKCDMDGVATCALPSTFQGLVRADLSKTCEGCT